MSMSMSMSMPMSMYPCMCMACAWYVTSPSTPRRRPRCSRPSSHPYPYPYPPTPPQAPTLLAAFLVRAVSDDLLPPAFARTLPPEALSSAQHRDTLTQARAQLDATHFSGHRQKVWGPAADADLPTLKEAVSEIAREYFVSCEVTEAVRCVRELDAPPFGHEVIKRLFVLALDGGARHVALAEQLVQRLCDEAVVPPQQLALGCERLLDAAADLAIDNPQTPTELAGVLERFCECGHLVPPEEWRASIESLRARG